MNYNKKITIAIGIFFSILLFSMSMIHIALNFMYPGNELAESIQENFKDSFGKSIKFDSLVFKYNGDIILQNFYLSNTTDFNDNVNLIKCSEVVIDTYLFDLLREKITFSAVIMYKPEINIIKNYGKSYTDTFISDIVTGFKNDKISQFITKKFSIVLTDSQLFYREIFKKSKTSIDLFDIDIDIVFYGEELEYDIDGSIINNNISGWRSCGFDAEGTILFKESKSHNRIKFKNIDISLINNLLGEYYNEPFLFKGELSGDLNFNSNKDIIDIIAGINICDLYASDNNTSSPVYIVKDEDINIEFDLSAFSTMDKVTINKLKVDDEIVTIELKSDYIKDEHLDLSINSNKIDLSRLSSRFLPFKRAYYEGDFSLTGNFKFNLKEMIPEELALDVKLNGFTLTPSVASDNNNSIRNCNALIAADKENFLLKSKLNTGNTDLDITFNSRISGWNPFKSVNQAEIISKKMEIELLKNVIISGIDSIYNMAYVDMFQNFDEQRNFLKEPEGIFINNNDFKLNIKADKLVVKKGASFDDFNLAMNLSGGIVKTDIFSLHGYDGIFNFNAYAVFRQEYPFIKIEGGVENLNIAKMAVDSDSAINAAGILSSDFKFETNAFRIGQIVENGRASLNLGIKDGYISRTDNLKKLDNFIMKNAEYHLPDPMTFDSLTFTFMQSANEFYIRSFNMNGTKCSFNAYGKYTENDGLNVPVNLNINIDNTYKKIPLLIFGNLRTPCVKINTKKESEHICFQ
ncbi:MAG TPA: hypothetical protein PLT13_00565 [Spirochaetota bacterium]|nr:hypothetical protein [Spirochaetota bacterium]